MNSILKQIIPSLSLALFLGLQAAVSAQSLTTRELQQINSSLFRPNSQDFFLQGNRQLEQEITILGVADLEYDLPPKFSRGNS